MPKKIKPRFKLTLKEKIEFVQEEMDSQCYVFEVEVDEKYQEFKESLIPYFLGGIPSFGPPQTPRGDYAEESFFGKSLKKNRRLKQVDFQMIEETAHITFRKSLKKIKSVSELKVVAQIAVAYYLGRCNLEKNDPS